MQTVALIVHVSGEMFRPGSCFLTPLVLFDKLCLDRTVFYIRPAAQCSKLPPPAAATNTPYNSNITYSFPSALPGQFTSAKLFLVDLLTRR